jgi:hypothetical protein
MAQMNTIVPFAILVIVVLISFLFMCGNTKAKFTNAEMFSDVRNLPSMRRPDTSVAAMAPANPNIASSGLGNYRASDPNGDEMYNPVVGGKSAPSGSCFPRDRLTASDLLPKDAANSRWAQMNPAGQGDVSDQNFLTAGYHVGINTTGSSKKNGNLQLRSDPPVPKMAVSPWNISSYESTDAGGRKPFEIGSD